MGICLISLAPATIKNTDMYLKGMFLDIFSTGYMTLIISIY